MVCDPIKIQVIESSDLYAEITFPTRVNLGFKIFLTLLSITEINFAKHWVYIRYERRRTTISGPKS
jgi:hypothetical protein